MVGLRDHLDECTPSIFISYWRRQTPCHRSRKQSANAKRVGAMLSIVVAFQSGYRQRTEICSAHRATAWVVFGSEKGPKFSCYRVSSDDRTSGMTTEEFLPQPNPHVCRVRFKSVGRLFGALFSLSNSFMGVDYLVVLYKQRHKCILTKKNALKLLCFI